MLLPENRLLHSSAKFAIMYSAATSSARIGKLFIASQMLLPENRLLHSFAKSAIMYSAATFSARNVVRAKYNIIVVD